MKQYEFNGKGFETAREMLLEILNIAREATDTEPKEKVRVFRGQILEDDEDEVLEQWADADFDDYLNEVYLPYEIGGLEFQPDEILKNCDPIAYECMKDGFADSLREEIEDLELELSLHEILKEIEMEG